MTWSPPPAPGWWVELSFNRWVAGVAAEMRAGEQDKRQRQLRRRVERVDEALCLAAGARDARRALRRQGLPYESYERSARLGPIEHSAGRRAGPATYTGASVLSVR
jgi:hypothetical protein